jgi:hypothetical protein
MDKNNLEEYTIVTAFYLMKSKFNPDKYKQWISNFIKLNMNCILFTNLETKRWMESWADIQNFHICIIEMDDFITVKYDWNKQYEMDDEKYHSRELYMIWNEKINFLKIANEKNPYQTEWFLWCDMGSLRQPMFQNEYFKSSSVLKSLQNDKTYFFLIDSFKHHNPYFIYNLDKYMVKSNIKIIQGGFILTNTGSCKDLHLEYYHLLDILYEKGLFIGKDQCCYLSLVNNSRITNVLEIMTHKYSIEFNDPWFYVYPFMLGVSKYKKVNYL